MPTKIYKKYKRKSRKLIKNRVTQKGGSLLKDITIGILTWKSCNTLTNTLKSYNTNGLFELINAFVYIQEMGNTEKQIVEQYNIPYIGTDINIGIQKALMQMIQNTSTKYFIFAEDDFELIHNKDETAKVLEDCIKLLDDDNVQIVKLRDTANPGEPNYSHYTYENDFKGKPNQQDFPYKLEALSYIDNPEEEFPNAFIPIDYNYKWYKSSSKHNKWSNNIFMAKTDWLKEKVIPLIDPSRNNTKNIYIFENALIDNLKDYNLAAGIGLFKHNRLDRNGCVQSGGKTLRNKKSKKHTRKHRKMLKQKGGNNTTAYVINLKDRTDRKEIISNKFKDSSIQLEFVEVERHPDGPHAGTGDSFMKIIQKAVDLNLNAVLMFEDDNMPLDDFDAQWNNTKQWLDSNMDKWEIFNGGARIYDNPTITLKYKVSENINLFEMSQFLGLNWIYLNSSVFKKALTWTIEKDGPIDKYLGNNTIFKNLCIYPYLGLQEVGISNSWGHHMNLSNNDKRMKNIFQKVLNDQQGGNNSVYIKRTSSAEAEALYPILKNVFPNKKIEFVEHRDSYDLIIIHCLGEQPPNQPYILICGEEFHALKGNLNDQNCVGYFLSTADPRTKDVKNYYYFPLFLTIGYELYNKSPFVRKYTHHTKPRLCAFVARNATTQREKMFNALKSVDSTVDALGSALHNKDVTLPQYWWDLPEVYKPYKFVLAIENSDKEEGYITEKIMNAYRASAIPIYWGTEKIKEIFNPDSFIYMKDYMKDGSVDYDACAKDIVAISNDPVRYKKMLHAPIFNKHMKPDLSTYYDSPSPKWVLEIAKDVKKRLNNQKGGSDTIYVNNVFENSQCLDPIIKQMYPNKNIVYAGDKEKYDLTVVSCLYGEAPKDNTPYIMLCGESYDPALLFHKLNDKCIGIFLASNDERSKQLKNYYYFPFFLSVGPYVSNTNPLVKTYKDTPKTRLCAFISRACRDHRKAMFDALFAIDQTKTTDALSVACHTRNIELPENWWDLPEVYKTYKFVMAFENKDEYGYISEKIMNAYRGGAIPIYWGTSKAKEIFHPDSFIYVKDYVKADGSTDFDACAKEIIAIANDPVRYKKMQDAPIFNTPINNYDFSKYYESPSPQWVVDIANELNGRLSSQTGGKKRKTRKHKKKQKGGAKPTIHVITVSTKENSELQRLLNSAKKNNITIEVLGLNMNTENLGHSNNAKFGMKLGLPLEYINKIDENDLVLFTDAWDVVYNDNLEHIYEKYKKFNMPIVFGAELYSWPDADKASMYVDTQNEYFKYLNSGLYIGVAKVIKDILNNYKGGEDIDDQRFWVDMYFKNRDKIVIDTKAELFLNTTGTDKAYYDFSNGFIFKGTSTTPSIIHANGADKTYLDLFSVQGGASKEITWFLPVYVPFVNAGAEMVAHAMNKYFMKNGFTINVVGNWEEQVIDGINYISEWNKENVDAAVERSIALFAQQTTTFSTLSLGKLHNKNVFIVVHNTERQFYDPEKFKTLIDSSKIFLVFNSEWVKNDYNTDLKSMVVYPPVNCEDYSIASTNKYVTLINVSELKGGNQFIEIAKKMPHVEFLGVEGGYDEQIKGDLPNITYVPNTKDMKSIYGQTHILLMPSSAETWGRTATEALCSGIPVIANPTNGLKENLGDAGLYVDRNAINDWVVLIQKLKDDSNYYNAVSAKCKERSAELNSTTQLDNLIKQIENIQMGGNNKIVNLSNKGRLGDCMFTVIYLNTIRKYLEDSNITVNYYIGDEYIEQINDFLQPTNKNVVVQSISSIPADTIETWMGQSKLYTDLVSDKPYDQSMPLDKWFPIFYSDIGAKAGLEKMTEYMYEDNSLLDRYNKLDDKYKDLDLLIINSPSISGDCPDRNNKSQEWDDFVRLLNKKYKLVTTEKVDDIVCTTDDNLKIKDIASISTHVKNIISVHTGPVVGLFNKYTLNNYTSNKDKKWFIYSRSHRYTLPNFYYNMPFDEVIKMLEN